MKRTSNWSEVYFSCAPGYLEIFTLSYLWFGAIWTKDNQSRHSVQGYWFGDCKEDVLTKVKQNDWNSIVEVVDFSAVDSIYETFRRKQTVSDWNRRSYLPMRSLLTKRWRSVKAGWYILRSRDTYPFYLSEVRKRGWFVLVMHAAVCENEADKLHFIDKVLSMGLSCKKAVRLS
ncbi:hypothetical protein SD70_31370 [Gordoniibacillus kamchatkensis]|uniref:Uncharacterized protein n=1 Tax=Gordoniibacillus kamchatkensis TaxID=1590651 RepID=A0ABR5A8K5_9BACL|nr:hypothetical protein [Paenibacillus sp. VKM B-2647]KIL36747.1 hypothetical protein SD70_31370 [Paenibacillus sp. VKM B-2647]